MMIRTDCPCIESRSVITKKITNFWDQISDGWRMAWGPHIHHGFYENHEVITPLEAQEKLIKKLADLLFIEPQERILDVGCGMGGSSLYLAKKYQALVSGVTLSKKQVLIAQEQAKTENIKNVTFKVEDALSLNSFQDESFDILWSLESCEQFYNKKLFLQNAFRVLRPGGKFLLVTWCSNAEVYQGKLAREYRKLCLAFDLPYMPTMEHYSQLLEEQNYAVTAVYDWTDFVRKSWEVGISMVQMFSFLQILKTAGWRGLRFTRQIKLMKKAFSKGMVKYAVFIGTCPK